VVARHVERPAAGNPVGALVFFHGFGGEPEELLRLLDRIDPERRFHGYLPEAPHRDAGGGPSWFVRGGTTPPEAQIEPVVRWLDGLPYGRDRMVLGGWSQGSNLAYSVALGPGQPRPAGVVALAGGFRDELPPDLERPLPPVAIVHGRHDESVSVEVARSARDALERAGGTVLYLETEIGHAIDDAVIPDLRAFLAALP
jgi:predicted esterase